MDRDFNPFLDKGYRSPSFFCDREEETKLLTDFIGNQSNVTLFAFRRLGKTGLIHHVFYRLRKEKHIKCIYLDIFDTSNKAEFVNKLATAIYAALPPKTSLGKQVWKTIQLFRPVLSFDELTGTPNLTITTTKTQDNNTISGLLSFLDQQNIQIVFAIDEFQQILNYPEKNMEALLRTTIQTLKNTSFIFCGSNQSQMHEIFNSAKRPFFASCTSLSLSTIPKKKYKQFIHRLFRKYNKSITEEAIDFICEWTTLHTFYTQYLCNQIFTKTGSKIELEDCKQVAAGILEVQEGKFYQYRYLLTATQWKLLNAVAKESRLEKPHAKDFINDYQLGSPSIVSRALEALVKKEMILHNTGVEKPYYEVNDKFLMRWLQSK